METTPNSTNPTAWIFDEILQGLQRLSCLGLDRQPAAELLPGTARTWLQAIHAGKRWDRERDVLRFRAAFTTLTQNRRTWPAPADFLDAIPKAEPHLALPPVTLSPEQAQQRLDEIGDLLKQPPAWKGEGPAPRTGLSEAAKEIARNLERQA